MAAQKFYHFCISTHFFFVFHRHFTLNEIKKQTKREIFTWYTFMQETQQQQRAQQAKFSHTSPEMDCNRLNVAFFVSLTNHRFEIGPLEMCCTKWFAINHNSKYACRMAFVKTMEFSAIFKLESNHPCVFTYSRCCLSRFGQIDFHLHVETLHLCWCESWTTQLQQKWTIMRNRWTWSSVQRAIRSLDKFIFVKLLLKYHAQY